MKKLLYITSRVFWPTKSGHEVHIFNYCRALHEKYGYSVDVYILANEKTVEEAVKNKPDFLNEVICGEKISKVSILKNLLGKTIFSKEHWSLQSSLYFNKLNCKKLDGLNEKEEYDVLFVDMVRLAPYLKAFNKSPKLNVLDMGDMLSKRYERQISNVSKKSNVGGAYTNGMSKTMQSILKPKWIQTSILKIESRLMTSSELFWAEKYDSVILVSTVETEELNNKLSKPKAVTVRVGVDSEFFSENRDVQKEEGLVAFLGDMRTAANSDTVGHIVNDILPLCQNVKKVLFIGKCPEELKETYKENKRIHFTGMVPDIRDEVKKANVFLAPMAYGTGVKIKIVEAMAMGMPVVTNAIGAEGIPGENGVHWYVGNSDKEIAEYVDLLIDNPEISAHMSVQAQKLVDDNFSWNAATKAFAKAGL